MQNHLSAKLLAEFIGTFAFVFIGAGAAAVVGTGAGGRGSPMHRAAAEFRMSAAAQATTEALVLRGFTGMHVQIFSFSLASPKSKGRRRPRLRAWRQWA